MLVNHIAKSGWWCGSGQVVSESGGPARAPRRGLGRQPNRPTRTDSPPPDTPPLLLSPFPTSAPLLRSLGAWTDRDTEELRRHHRRHGVTRCMLCMPEAAARLHAHGVALALTLGGAARHRRAGCGAQLPFPLSHCRRTGACTGTRAHSPTRTQRHPFNSVSLPGPLCCSRSLVPCLSTSLASPFSLACLLPCSFSLLPPPSPSLSPSPHPLLFPFLPTLPHPLPPLSCTHTRRC